MTPPAPFDPGDVHIGWLRCNTSCGGYAGCTRDREYRALALVGGHIYAGYRCSPSKVYIIVPGGVPSADCCVPFTCFDNAGSLESLTPLELLALAAP